MTTSINELELYKEIFEKEPSAIIVVDEFQANGASLVMIAKGNRSDCVTEACKKHGGFYLGPSVKKVVL